MSFNRKNAHRLRDLRQHGVPLGGDYRLTADWNEFKQGDYIDTKTQKELMVKFGPINRNAEPGSTPRGLRRGRAA